MCPIPYKELTDEQVYGLSTWVVCGIIVMLGTNIDVVATTEQKKCSLTRKLH